MLLTVSTVKDSVDNVAFFVAANLAAGVDHMFVCLDAPAEPEQRDVAASLADHPHVTCLPTTRRDWWAEQRPAGLNVRQRANAGWVRAVLEPFGWAEWLFHVDGDEVAWLDREALAAVPSGTDAVWLPPWEAVSQWQGEERPRSFKRLLDDADLTLLQVLGRIPEATNQAYFHGHVMGKSGVRPASGLSLTLHDAVTPDGAKVERHEDPRLKVLHYDAPSGEEFVRKWTALAHAGPARYRASRAPVAKALRSLVARDLPDDVRARYLREIYELEHPRRRRDPGRARPARARRPDRVAGGAAVPLPRRRRRTGGPGRGDARSAQGPVRRRRQAGRRPGRATRAAQAPGAPRLARRTRDARAPSRDAGSGTSRSACSALRRRTSPSMVATRSTVTAATSASVTDDVLRRSSRTSGTSRCSRSPCTSYAAACRCSTAARPRRRQSSTWSGSGQKRSPPIGTSRSSARKLPDPDAAVVGAVESLEPLVDAAQRLGLHDAHRGVGEGLRQVHARAVEADGGGELVPHVVARGAGVEHEHVHPLGGHGAGPALEDQAQVEGAPVPDVAGPLGHLAAVVGHPLGGAVLQALLPAGGEQPEGLSSGDDEVHLGRREGLDRGAGLGRAGRGEELVADQTGAVAGGELGADAVPGGALRLGRPLLAGLLAHGARGPQVVAALGAGDDDPALAQPVAVGPDDGLQVGRGRLGEPEVDEHPVDH